MVTVSIYRCTMVVTIHGNMDKNVVKNIGKHIVDIIGNKIGCDVEDYDVHKRGDTLEIEAYYPFAPNGAVLDAIAGKYDLDETGVHYNECDENDSPSWYVIFNVEQVGNETLPEKDQIEHDVSVIVGHDVTCEKTQMGATVNVGGGILGGEFEEIKRRYDITDTNITEENSGSYILTLKTPN